VLDPGDLLVMYSDGVIESLSTGGEDFGTDGILRSLPASTCARTVAAAIVDAASRHSAGSAQYDDLTVMVIGAYTTYPVIMPGKKSLLSLALALIATVRLTAECVSTSTGPQANGVN